MIADRAKLDGGGPYKYPMLLSTKKTSERLTDEGYPITQAHLGVLIAQGDGPPTQTGNRRYWANLPLLIDWDDALAWAEARHWDNRRLPTAVTDFEAIADQIILYLRAKDPERFQKIGLADADGPTRKRRLNAIAAEALELAETRLREIVD